jgi:hypothetical protein
MYLSTDDADVRRCVKRSLMRTGDSEARDPETYAIIGACMGASQQEVNSYVAIPIS